MTREEMKEVAKDAAREALSDMLLVLGVDASDPKSLLELQADLQHMRKWRKSMEQVQSVGWKTAITTLVTGGLALLWLGLQAKFGRIF